MTLTSLITNVRNLTDESDTTQLTDAVIIVFLNRRYHDLCSKIMVLNEDYFLTSDQSIDLVDGTREYGLATDTKKVKRVEISYDGATYTVARFIDRNEILDTESDESTYSKLSPRYYLAGTPAAPQIGFAPIPDENQTNAVFVEYLAVPVDLSGVLVPVIPAEYHDLLVIGASSDVKKRDDNYTAATNLEMDYEKGTHEMLMELKQRSISHPPSVKDIGDAPWRTPENSVDDGSLG